MPQSNTLLIGCAAGFSGDRPDAAVPVVDALIRTGKPAFLIFETLAERTLALAQLARRANPAEGYEPLLDELVRPVLGKCLNHGIRIVSNFGAANPRGAADRILAIARELGTRVPRIAVIEGDDLSAVEHHHLFKHSTDGQQLDSRMVSANAYIGAISIADALHAGADIVVAGRVADPALALGPALAHFGWAENDWDRLAGATIAGHLLECGAQVTGGYYADPGIKDVPGLSNIGYPIAEIHSDGTCVITKPHGTGGFVNPHTVMEQLLYEVHDPSAYITPDVVADISQVRVEDLGEDRVRVWGVRGHERPETLKVNVCYETGWLAEGEISYAGARADLRAELAANIVRDRLKTTALIRADLIGVSSIFADDAGRYVGPDYAAANNDVRLRLAMRHPDKTQAQRLLREITALYTCGPAGGGGVRTSLRATLGTLSCYVARDQVPTRFTMHGENT